MALTVETGAGLSSADSFASVADCDTHNTNYVNSSVWLAATTPNKELALRKATRYLVLTVGESWVGLQKTSTQALPWPRTGVVLFGFAFSDSAIPVQLVRATCEMAIISLSEEILPTDDSASTIVEEEVQVGPILERIKYASGKTITKSYPICEGYLTGLRSAGSRVDRA